MHRKKGLNEQIAQLQHARELLAGALLCPFDHPATDCKTMGAEIDRRLDGPAYARRRSGSGRMACRP
jgi:hypothetical protein